MSIFAKMPKIEYNGYILTDISKRLAIIRSIKENKNIFEYYNIEEYESAESLAQDFYSDPEMVWLIYLMNDIVDPFYGWILRPEALRDFITAKYGTGNADTVHHYISDGLRIDALPLYGFNSSVSSNTINISSGTGINRHDLMAGSGTAVSGVTHTARGLHYIEYRLVSGAQSDFIYGLGITGVSEPGLQSYDATTMSYPANSNIELGIALRRVAGDYIISENFNGVVISTAQTITMPASAADNIGILLNLDNYSIRFYVNGAPVGNLSYFPAARVKNKFVSTLYTSTSNTGQILDFTEQEYFSNIQALFPDANRWQVDAIPAEVYPVSNKMHEENINDSKRKIKIIRPDFVDSIINNINDVI